MYPTAVPRTEDVLRLQQNTMTALGALAQAAFGTQTCVDGFPISVTNPATMSVTLGPGSVYEVENLEQSQWSILPVDTHNIVKQGILLDPVPITVSAPQTVNTSQCYLIQVQYADLDDSPVLLSYYNSINPAQPFSGPGGNGLSQSTRRAGIVAVQAKAGIIATSGTQQIPTPDAGWAGLYVVTVAYGQSAVQAGNIAPYSGAPFIAAKLPQIPTNIQNRIWTFVQDQGAQNAVVINPTPAATAYVRGMSFEVQMAFAPTGASTINISGLGLKPLVVSGGGQVPANAWAANDVVRVTYDGANVQVLTGGGGSSSGAAGNAYVQLVTQTLTLNVPSTNYPTIQSAVLAAGQLFISPNVYVIIQVAAGYTEYLTAATGPIYLSHAHGQRCKIIGAPLNGAFPAYADIQGAGSNANTLTLLRSRFRVEINAVGVNAIELHSGYWNVIQNILITGDGTNSGGHYGIKVGDWSTEVGMGSMGLLNVWVHGFGLDNVRAEQTSVIQAVNVGSTYSSAHAFHISHYSVLEVNIGNLLAMYSQVGVMLQNAGQLAIDSASGTIDVAYSQQQGIGSPDYGIVNAYSATGFRIRNNGTYGINMVLFSAVALPSGGQTVFSGNASGDISVAYASTVVTYGCSLPGGSSPSRGAGYSSTQGLVL